MEFYRDVLGGELTTYEEGGLPHGEGEGDR